MASKRKLVVPPREQVGDTSQRWIKSCLEYLRTECQLAANTIAAYTRDLLAAIPHPPV